MIDQLPQGFQELTLLLHLKYIQYYTENICIEYVNIYFRDCSVFYRIESSCCYKHLINEKNTTKPSVFAIISIKKGYCLGVARAKLDNGQVRVDCTSKL